MRTKTPQVSRLAQLIRFLRVSHLLLWTMWIVYRERRRVVPMQACGNSAIRPENDALVEVLVTFRETAVELGVLMIKLGQFLSSRPDLLPEKAIAVLSSLQDGVPPRLVRSTKQSLPPPVRRLPSKFSAPIATISFVWT